MNLSNEIIAFANGNTDFYVAFADYHNHKENERYIFTNSNSLNSILERSIQLFPEALSALS